MTKMTKEEFLQSAQIYFYGDYRSSDFFDLMDNSAKDLAITSTIEDENELAEYEFSYLVKNEKLLLYYFNQLIANDDELTETFFKMLTFEQMDIWYNMLHNVYIKEYPDGWENNWIVSLYRGIKAAYRNKQIDTILDD